MKKSDQEKIEVLVAACDRTLKTFGRIPLMDLAGIVSKAITTDNINEMIKVCGELKAAIAQAKGD